MKISEKIYYFVYNETKDTSYSGGSYGGRFGSIVKLYSRRSDAEAAIKGFKWDLSVLGRAAHGGLEKKDKLVIREARIVPVDA